MPFSCIAISQVTTQLECSLILLTTVTLTVSPTQMTGALLFICDYMRREFTISIPQ